TSSTEAVEPATSADTASGEQATHAVEPTQPETAESDEWLGSFMRDPRFGADVKAEIKRAAEGLQDLRDFYGSVRGAREFGETLKTVGGIDGLRSLKQRVEGFEKVGEVFDGHDEESKRAYFEGLSQQNPKVFFSAVLNALDVLKTRNPQEYQN